MKSIILIAPPAAGKGTQAKRIHDVYHIPNISLGEIMRHARDDSTEIGRKIIECQDKRELVPLPITLKLIKNRLSMQDCKSGYILDGFPRTIEQALAYDKMLKEIDAPTPYVIFLDIDKDLALKRTLGRLVCPNCGENYNIHFSNMSPKQENICDHCHHTLVKRTDDTSETFYKGFQVYLDNTVDLIDFYEKKGVLKKIKVLEELTPEDIFCQIQEVLDCD